MSNQSKIYPLMSTRQCRFPSPQQSRLELRWSPYQAAQHIIQHHQDRRSKPPLPSPPTSQAKTRTSTPVAVHPVMVPNDMGLFRRHLLCAVCKVRIRWSWQLRECGSLNWAVSKTADFMKARYISVTAIGTLGSYMRGRRSIGEKGHSSVGLLGIGDGKAALLGGYKSMKRSGLCE